MEIKIKKIIAREVLCLFFVNALILISWYTLVLRGIYFENKIENSSVVSYTVNTELKETLRKFVATSNSGKYETEKELLAKFPELVKYDVQSLRDFVATSNSGKYETEKELMAKFPEFYDDVSKRKCKKIQSEINEYRCKLDSNSYLIDGYLPIFALILYCLVYPIRFLYYLLYWSFEVLRK